MELLDIIQTHASDAKRDQNLAKSLELLPPQELTYSMFKEVQESLAKGGYDVLQANIHISSWYTRDENNPSNYHQWRDVLKKKFMQDQGNNQETKEALAMID